MNDLILYAILGLMGLAIVYLIAKVRQPVELRTSRERKEDVTFIDDVGEIGEIIKELQPEIEKGLKLDDKQKESLTHWITTIDKVTKSKLLKWGLKKVMK